MTPFHKNIARAIRKEPKFYFYDVGRVQGDAAAKFENLVAVSLLKEVQRLHDVEGIRAEMHVLKTRDGREIDFLVHSEEHPALLVDAKSDDQEFSPNFKYFESAFPKCRRVQVVATLTREK